MSLRYAVKGKIGAGGLGEVYLATDTQLDRDVALKRVKPPESGSAEALHQDLIREARTLSSLQHPHIVTIYDVGQDDQGPFVVMELLKGETLDQVIERGALTVDDFHEVVVQTLEGMIAAQELGLVHRDLKPGNLMVIWLASGKFQIKILDFGLAKFSVTATRQTEDQESGIMGSIYFMAPEQFERLPLDARTDMYSLGCIFYQILTTRYPFDGQTGAEVMVAHLQHHVQHLVEARPDLPVWMADWVMWLISRDMDERPPDARTALDFFRAQQSGIRNPTPVAAVPRGPVVKIVGRGSGPGGITQQIGAAPGTASAAAATRPATQRVAGHSTQKVTGHASQRLQGTVATARSSRPGARKVTSKSSTGPWIVLLLLVAGAGGGAVWWLTRKPATPADSRAALEAVLTNPSPPADAATLTLLLDTLRSDSADAPRAAGVLKKMKGPAVAGAVAAALPQSTGAPRLMLLDVMATHPSRAGTAGLLKIIATESGPVRRSALDTLVKTGAPSDVPDLLKVLSTLKDPAGREAMLATLGLLLEREADTTARVSLLTDALGSADSATRPDVLRLLGRTGHSNASRALAEEIATPGDRRRAALAVLKEWAVPDTTLTDALLAAATSSPTDRDALITAWLELAPRLAAWNGAELTAALRRAAPLTTSTSARTAFAAALGSTPAPEAAGYAKELASDSAWSAAAGQAAAAITALQAGQTALQQPGETHLDASKAVILPGAEKDLYFTATSRYVTNWKNPASRIAWDITVTAPVSVGVQILQSTSLRLDRTFRVRLGTTSHETPVATTDSNETFTRVDAGQFQIPGPGTWRLWVEPARMEPGQPLFNVREAVLTVQ